ncbi:MAG: TonB-dependent receptor [Hyphomonadaceae bacterium]|nr:TonB-dependent receptor [Hyphomonadaceae bacterium]
MGEKSAFRGLTRSALLAGVALAAATPSAFAQESAQTDELVVTGYRASLQSSTIAKRESTAFTDSVFAEDIGQFPDLNIAESLNRIPGITVAREVNGEGLNIAIRGLNTNFTKTVLNNTQIAVASSGSADSQNVNRELDLDLFPSELFTRLDVSKSASAHQLEGGVAGIVNMRSARPFDYAESQITYTLQGSYAENNEEWSPRGAIIASGRWETSMGEFGALVGYSGVNNKSTTLGYETIGVTNANLTYRQCGIAPPAGTSIDSNAASCNTTGGNGFQIGGNAGTTPTVPATTTSGLPVGAVIDAAFLTARNPGVTAQQIGNALLPRLGRPAYFDGERQRDAAIASVQWSPNDDVELYIDAIWAGANRVFNRIDLMFEVRSFNTMIPLQLEVDANNVVTYGKFANSRLFLEARPYDEDLDFYNINPGGHFNITDNLSMDVQANLSRSVFFRQQPTIGFGLTPLEVEYVNRGGEIPEFNYARNPNDPNAGWSWIRAFLQAEKRVTSTKGFHSDFTWGDDTANIKFGAAWDEVGRSIVGLDNNRLFQNFTCGGGQPSNIDGGCNGAAGSAIPTSMIASLLTPSEAGFVTPNYNQIFKLTNYYDYLRTASLCPLACTGVAGAATGARSGEVLEETLGAYIEVNGETEIADRTLRFNAGVRYISTDQTITAPNTFPVNGVGGLVFIALDSTYDEYLPAANVAYDLTDNIVLRMSSSRTITRQNPDAMLPSTTFSDPSAQQANQGNPNLAPFLSTNFDFGGEWYTGGEGYVGFALFNKRLTGFTQTGTTTVPFTSLGIPFDSLVQAQRDAINGRGGPSTATVVVNQQINAGGTLTIKGYELNWVQPLDFLLDGLGFTANYTKISQSGSGAGAPVIATNVSPVTYNVTGYYENHGFSGRVSYTWNDEQQNTSSPQDGFNGGTQPQAGQRFTEERGQLDLALRYTLEHLPTSPQITLDAINVNGATRREYQGYNNLAYRYYEPGYSLLLGVRGTF